MENYQTFIAQYIAEKRGLELACIDMSADMFEQHYIDSLGVFTLLMELENAFNVRFDEQDMSDKKMHTIQGMARVIENKQSG